uniref:Uncharacterized protein n=1 Tax=Cladonia uncialis subsp. uncialis TaxID=180999 RepID=A0A1Z1CJ88_CLAUC|nr:hypothetical protein [Cladonia uncialis subsp. uncialis]AUW31422.1 hypothetical protein [Cladonia uncialis subsp. uncialis]
MTSRPAPVALLDKTPSPHDGLGLLGWFTVSPATTNTIQTNSSPNSIGFNLVGEVDSLTAPTITTSYSGSTVQSFTLYIVYMGCVVINPLGVYEPQSCSVLATGTNANGSTATQSLTFTVPFPVPLADLPEAQQLNTFESSFTDLTNVVFSVSAAGTATPLAGVSFDNMVYDLIYNCADCTASDCVSM